MKKLVVLAAFVVCIFSVNSAYADNLTGTKVAGDLSIDGSADAFSPIVETIGPGVEFSYIGAVFTYTADFFNNGLIISDTCNAKIVKCIAAAELGGTYTLTFLDTQFDNDLIATDPAADGLGLFGFRGAAEFTVIGEIGVTGTTTFAIEPIPTPEPGSIFLLGTGMLGVATGVLRRRLFA